MKMAEYEFELTFELQKGESGEQYLDALAEAGCDDAVVGFGKPGVLALDFSREAVSANEAVSSAIVDVKQAIPHARLVEAKPDLVGITDMGELFGVSRQHMRKFVFEGRDAPVPIHSGNPSLWRLRDITEWMVATKLEIRGAPVSLVQVELARTTMAVNFVRHWCRLQESAQTPEDFMETSARDLPEVLRACLSEEALKRIA